MDDLHAWAPNAGKLLAEMQMSHAHITAFLLCDSGQTYVHKHKEEVIGIVRTISIAACRSLLQNGEQRSKVQALLRSAIAASPQ